MHKKVASKPVEPKPVLKLKERELPAKKLVEKRPMPVKVELAS
jgi:hypothetical protein